MKPISTSFSAGSGLFRRQGYIVNPDRALPILESMLFQDKTDAFGGPMESFVIGATPVLIIGARREGRNINLLPFSVWFYGYRDLVILICGIYNANGNLIRFSALDPETNVIDGLGEREILGRRHIGPWAVWSSGEICENLTGSAPRVSFGSVLFDGAGKSAPILFEISNDDIVGLGEHCDRHKKHDRDCGNSIFQSQFRSGYNKEVQFN